MSDEGSLFISLLVVGMLFFAVWLNFSYRPRKQKNNNPSHSDIKLTVTDPKEYRRIEWEEGLTPLWQGKIPVHFGYKWGNERTRRDVTVNGLLISLNDTIYLQGHCHLRNELRHFNCDKISSKVKILSTKRYYPVGEFIDSLINGEKEHTMPMSLDDSLTKFASLSIKIIDELKPLEVIASFIHERLETCLKAKHSEANLHYYLFGLPYDNIYYQSLMLIIAPVNYQATFPSERIHPATVLDPQEGTRPHGISGLPALTFSLDKDYDGVVCSLSRIRKGVGTIIEPLSSNDILAKTPIECRIAEYVEYMISFFENVVTENDTSEYYESLYYRALETVQRHKTASISFLQRELRIGFNSVANIMERMEEEGIVGPQEGSKPRRVL